MTLVVALFGCFVAALGVAGLLRPSWLLDLVTHVQSQLGLLLIAAFRLLLGVVFLFAADASRAPLYLRILGGLSLLSGALTPFFGVQRFEAILAWWRRRAAWVVRAWSALVLAFGVSLVWVVLP